MKDEFKIVFVDREKQKSEFDWADIDWNGQRVGKIRAHIRPDRLIIYSINVYEDFRSQGFGHRVLDYFKERYDIIEADHVRFKAIQFWEREGMYENPAFPGNWIYIKAK